MFVRELIPPDYSLSHPYRFYFDCDSRQMFLSQWSRREFIIQVWKILLPPSE